MRLAATWLLLLAASAAGALEYEKYYEGLPDLDAARPFEIQSSDDAARLRELLSRVSSYPCAPRPEQIAGAQEICGSEAAATRELLAKMARGLPSGEFSGLWLAELGAGKARALIAQYDLIAAGKGDRYAAFFAFQWREGRYRVTVASWFLEGSLHAVRSFGPDGRSAAFIRLVSCTGCCQWVYLVAWDFAGEPDAVAYEFSDAVEDDNAWQPQIEYELPGKGHSIDAKVETRLPARTASGPHLLQHFDVDDGEDEWWSFRCEGLRCKPRVFKGEPPAWLSAAWSEAGRL